MPTARFFVSSFALSATVLLWFAGNLRVLAHQNAPPARTPDPLDGAKIFRNYCASCHGVNGNGDGPVAPALKNKVPLLTTLARRNLLLDSIEQAQELKTQILKHVPAGREPYMQALLSCAGTAKDHWSAIMVQRYS